VVVPSSAAGSSGSCSRAFSVSVSLRMIVAASSRMPWKDATWPTARRIRCARRWLSTASPYSPASTLACSRAGRSIKNCSFVRLRLTLLSPSSCERRSESDELTESLAAEIVPMLVSSWPICVSISSTRVFILRIVSVAEMNWL